MAFQNLYKRSLDAALPGMLCGAPVRAISGMNKDGLFEADITITAVDSTAYAVTLQGVILTYTSDGTATTAEIRDGLIAAHAANGFLGDFVFSAKDADEIKVKAKFRMPDVSLAVGANLAVATVASSATLRAGTLVGRAGLSADGENLLISPAVASQTPVGALIHSQASRPDDVDDRWLIESAGAADSSGVLPGQMCGVLKEGVIWLIAEEALAPGAAMYYRVAKSGSNNILGAVTGTDDGSNTDALAGAFYSILEYKAGIGPLHGLVKVSLALA